MSERVKYKVRQIKLPASASSREHTPKQALGAQGIKMRDDAAHEALREAGTVWQRHRTEQKQRWLDWTEILGPALVKVQNEAMAVASTNKPQGKRYSHAMSGLLETYRLNEIEGTTRSHAILIVQNLQAVTDWRAEQEKPERLNHPTTVWRRSRQRSSLRLCKPSVTPHGAIMSGLKRNAARSSSKGTREPPHDAAPLRRDGRQVEGSDLRGRCVVPAKAGIVGTTTRARANVVSSPIGIYPENTLTTSIARWGQYCFGILEGIPPNRKSLFSGLLTVSGEGRFSGRLIRVRLCRTWRHYTDDYKKRRLYC